MDADFDLSVLWSALWRSRYTILRPTIAVAILTFVVVLLIPPRYQSESRVLVVGRDNIYLRPDVDRDITDRNAIDAEAVTSQAQLVLSRDLALEVINKLKLGERPEFDPAVGGISLIRTALGFVGLVKNPKGLTPEERTLDAFYDRLTVYPVDKSRVIVIDFLSEDPELAARVANAVADAYLERQQFAKQDQARSAGAWLSGEIESLRKKVADAEGKVEQFRAKSNLLAGPNNTTLSAQQLGDLNGQLAAARTLKATAQAKAKIIREMLKSGGPIESSEILNSELIRRLSEQRVTLRAQLAEQSSSLLANHPRIKELKAQIADLDQQIRQEADTQARALENDSKLADARVDAQLATFDHFKGQVATGNEQDVELRALERDAKSQRDLLESYLAKYREASARDTIASAPPDARIISRAMVSSVPAYPKKLPTVLITTLATLVLASGMVLTREFLASPAIGAVGGAQRPARRLPPVRAMRSPERETEIGMERRDTRRRPEPEFAREPEAARRIRTSASRRPNSAASPNATLPASRNVILAVTLNGISPASLSIEPNTIILTLSPASTPTWSPNLILGARPRLRRRAAFRSASVWPRWRRRRIRPGRPIRQSRPRACRRARSSSSRKICVATAARAARSLSSGLLRNSTPRASPSSSPACSQPTAACCCSASAQAMRRSGRSQTIRLRPASPGLPPAPPRSATSSQGTNRPASILSSPAGGRATPLLC